MKEEWRDIPGYEGAYQASNLGRIRSLPRVVKRKHRWGDHLVEWAYKGRVLSARTKDCGHLNVGLGANNTQLVHRLVLLTFVGEPGQGQECRHLNGKPNDNRLANLVWGSRVDNRADMRAHAQLYRRRQGATHLSEESIRAIKLALKTGAKQKDIAAEFGVHVNTVSNIKRGFVHKWVDA